MTHRDRRPFVIPLVVRIEVPTDHIDERWIAAEPWLGQSHDPVIGLVHPLKVLLGGADRPAAAIMGGNVNQGLGPHDRGFWPSLLDRPRRSDSRRDELSLEPTALLRAY